MVSSTFFEGARKWVGPAVAALVALIWVASSLQFLLFPLLLRVSALLLFGLSFSMRFIPLFGRARRSWAFVFALGVICGVTPVEVSVINSPGHPRFVRFLVGLPPPEVAERAVNGDVVLGGCVGSGFDPTWVLVW